MLAVLLYDWWWYEIKVLHFDFPEIAKWEYKFIHLSSSTFHSVSKNWRSKRLMTYPTIPTQEINIIKIEWGSQYLHNKWIVNVYASKLTNDDRNEY